MERVLARAWARTLITGKKLKAMRQFVMKISLFISSYLRARRAAPLMRSISVDIIQTPALTATKTSHMAVALAGFKNRNRSRKVTKETMR